MPFWLMVSRRHCRSAPQTSVRASFVLCACGGCDRQPECQGRGDGENLADGSAFSIVREKSPFLPNRSGGQILSVSVVFWQLERQWPWKGASLSQESSRLLRCDSAG